jgi:ankyrin repeat protein
MLAVHSDHYEVAKLLLQNGVPLEAKRLNDGVTSLIYAFQFSQGRKHFVPLLLAYGANINATNNRGQSFASLASLEQLQEYQEEARSINLQE